MNEELRALRRLSHDLRGSVANLRIGLQACQENSELLSALGESMLSEVERLDRRLIQLSWLGRTAHPVDQPNSVNKLVQQWSPLPVEGEGVSAQVDADLLEAAIRELVRNANEHGGELTRVHVSNQAENWVVRIEHRGSDFPNGLTDWLERPGVRLWREQLALGLRLAQRVAEAHNGTLSLGTIEGGGWVEISAPRGPLEH